MSDMFHADVPTSYVDQVVGVMARCEALGRGHTFLMLTKRADRMRDYFSALVRCNESWPLPGLWLGVSVENQRMARERVPLILDTPAPSAANRCSARWIF
jgi:protein gp37